MTPETASRLVVLLPIAFVGLLLPWLAHSRRGILFGVTVPLDFTTSPEARSALRRYRLAVTALVLVIAVVAAILWLTPAQSMANSIAATLAAPVELLGGILLWRRQAQRIKTHAITIPLERNADLMASPSIAGPILATVLSLLLPTVTALWLHLRWDRITPRWPQHWNASGQVNGWGSRTPGGVYGPLLAGALIVAILIAVSLFISRASGPQSMQRRLALIPMAALAWLAAGLCSFIGALPLLQLQPTRILITIAIYVAVVFAVAFWLIWRSGLAPRSTSTEPYDSTPDACWHAGLFYYNPADAAVLVPKRFGWGWTLNFARLTAWVYLAAVILFAVLIGFVPHWLTHGR
jgi:uncharacterized membrane protein